MLTVRDDSRISPPKVVTEVGKDVEFTCESFDEPFWYINDLTSSPVKYPTIQLSQLQCSNSGQYFCLGTYDEYSAFFLAMAYLYVYGEFLNLGECYNYNRSVVLYNLTKFCKFGILD